MSYEEKHGCEIHARIPADMIKKLNEFQNAEGLKNRNTAVVYLMQQGLNYKNLEARKLSGIDINTLLFSAIIPSFFLITGRYMNDTVLTWIGILTIVIPIIILKKLGYLKLK